MTTSTGGFYITAPPKLPSSASLVFRVFPTNRSGGGISSENTLKARQRFDNGYLKH
jgi:hypothetical protein